LKHQWQALNAAHEVLLALQFLAHLLDTAQFLSRGEIHALLAEYEVAQGDRRQHPALNYSLGSSRS
jgi:hypothetical protein